MSDSSAETQLQSFTIDQAAGALALSLGALGSLLLVVWQSRCLCKCRVGLSDTCYLFDCSREPPPAPRDEEAGMDTDERLIPTKPEKTTKPKPKPEPELEPVPGPVPEPEPEREPIPRDDVGPGGQSGV